MTGRLAVGLLLALTLVGCGGQSEVRSGDLTVFVHDDALLPRGGTHAMVEGRLAVRDGCVLLENEEFQTLYPVIWPSATSIARAEPLTLRLPSGEELAAGQVVNGAGGYHHPSSEQIEVDIPARCLGDTDEVAVFNPDDDPWVGE